MYYDKLDYTLSESAKEYLDRLPKYGGKDVIDEMEALSNLKSENLWYLKAVSQALDLLDVGDRLKIVYPDIYGNPASEDYVVVVRNGRKRLRYTEGEASEGHKAIVLVFNAEYHYDEEDGVAYLEVTHTWNIKELKQ